jgi:hypothetical protein
VNLHHDVLIVEQDPPNKSLLRKRQGKIGATYRSNAQRMRLTLVWLGGGADMSASAVQSVFSSLSDTTYGVPHFTATCSWNYTLRQFDSISYFITLSYCSGTAPALKPRFSSVCAEGHHERAVYVAMDCCT